MFASEVHRLLPVWRPQRLKQTQQLPTLLPPLRGTTFPCETETVNNFVAASSNECAGVLVPALVWRMPIHRVLEFGWVRIVREMATEVPFERAQRRQDRMHPEPASSKLDAAVQSESRKST
jgi:hypothetical protein